MINMVRLTIFFIAILFMLLNNLFNLEEVENTLRNATFLTLFFTTIFYWIYTAFYVSPTSSSPQNIANISSSSYANDIYLSEETNPIVVLNPKITNKTNKKSFLLPRSIMVVSNFLLVLLLLVRWEKSGHFPLSNLYESLMFLAWCCTFLYLIFLNNKFTISVERSWPKGEKILGSITASCALLMNAFATFSLPKEMQQSAPLVPALQSNWLMMHVTVMIISYATLLIGSLLSILFLILNKNDNLNSDNGSPRQRQQNFYEGIGEAKANLDFLSYRIIGLGFPFLTIGILSGAVWANEAWGSYWSWDPKETWALLTWLVFAIYLHTRLTKGWQGKKPAIIASLGFLVVWFCYLGVNLLGEGLHSYGFFN